MSVLTASYPPTKPLTKEEVLFLTPLIKVIEVGWGNIQMLAVTANYFFWCRRCQLLRCGLAKYR